MSDIHANMVLIPTLPHDPALNQLLCHLVAVWPERRTAHSSQRVIPEMITHSGMPLSVLTDAAHREIDEITRGWLVLSRELTWWWSPRMRLFPTPLTVAEWQGLIPVRGDVGDYAQHMVDTYAVGEIVLTAEALAVPAWESATGRSATTAPPLRNSSTSDTVIVRRFLYGDESSPDTSQPYPLDGLLSRISDLTS